MVKRDLQVFGQAQEAEICQEPPGVAKRYQGKDSPVLNGKKDL